MKKSFGILCSILMLITSMGVTISYHYCGSEFQKQSVFGIPIEKNHDVHSCSDRASANCCSKNSENENCCSNEKQILEAEIDLFKFSKKEFSFDFVFLARVEHTLLVLERAIETEPIIIIPQIKRDKQVLFQTFLC